MDGAGNRGRNTQRIPVDLTVHRTKIRYSSGRRATCFGKPFFSTLDSLVYLCKKSSVKRKWLFYSLFFGLLVVGFYFTLTLVVPGFGDVRFPVLSYVQPFRFTDQDGRTVTQQDLQGKVYVTEYFFTTCPNICPMMNMNMAQVYGKYKKENDFLIVSHTCDPERDDPERLHRYADSLRVDTKKWLFLTGRKDSLYQLARTSYLLDDPQNNLTRIEDQFMHTQFFALVDRSGRVRKIYDGLKQSEIDQLILDIPLLIREPVSQKRFAFNLFSK